jgi:hypothetical protein
LALVVMCFSLTGCGSSQTDVTGQVHYNGKALEKPGGSILFIGPDGRKVTANVDGSGNYRAAGVSIGENKVAVIYMRPAPSGGPGRRAPDPAKGPDAAKAPKSSPYLTPETYADPETSELKVTVDKNTVYNPDLKGPELK